MSPPPPPLTRGARKGGTTTVATNGPASNVVAEVDAGSITAEEFWRNFVAMRRPALIRNLLTKDPSFQRVAERWVDDAHMADMAGDQVVEVERGAYREVVGEEGAAATAAAATANGGNGGAAPHPNPTTTVRFGLGDRTRMTLREFLEQRRHHHQPLYLSTQTHPRAPEDGAGPDVYGPPLRRTPLCGEPPLTPPLLAPLIPQAINVWWGGGGGEGAQKDPSLSSSSSSSGLHHDYHDNLYVLVRGSKRFRLWPVAAIKGMYPHGGQPTAVHSSGRVVYAPQTAESVLPDGTDAGEAARWRRRRDAERGVALAEARARRREPGAKQALREAESALEAALELELDERAAAAAACGDEDEDEDEEGGGDLLLEGMHDDYDELCGGEEGGGGEDDEERSGDGDASDDKDDDDDDDDAVKEQPPPPSFSRVDLSPYPHDGPAEYLARADAQLRAEWPLFPGLSSATVARVESGDALFLPAGWFHEVTTYSGRAGSGGSLALNYWFYPPDALEEEEGKEGEKSGPYRASGGFLPELWRRRLEWLAPRHAALRAVADARWAARGKAGARREALAKLREQRAAEAAAAEATTRTKKRRKRDEAGEDEEQNGTAVRTLLRFHERVGHPDNRYRTSTTRPGSASGAPSVPPKLSAERRERLGLGGGGGGGGGGPEEDEEAEEGEEQEQAAEDEEEEEEANGDDDGEDEEDEEDQAAALHAMLRASPELRARLMARLASMRGQQAGGQQRRPSRAGRLFLARRQVFCTHRRRHHVPAGGWRGRKLAYSGPGECETRGEVAAGASGVQKKRGRR